MRGSPLYFAAGSFFFSNYLVVGGHRTELNQTCFAPCWETDKIWKWSSKISGLPLLKRGAQQLPILGWFYADIAT